MDPTLGPKIFLPIVFLFRGGFCAPWLWLGQEGEERVTVRLAELRGLGKYLHTEISFSLVNMHPAFS